MQITNLISHHHLHHKIVETKTHKKEWKKGRKLDMIVNILKVSCSNIRMLYVFAKILAKISLQHIE